MPDPLFAFPEKTVLLREWRIFVFRGQRRRVIFVERDLVVRCDFGRQHLGREIERHARFRFRLVLRETFFHQFAEFRDSAFQIADRSWFEREQAAVAECFDRCGARRAVQNRKLAKKIALAVEGEIVLAFRCWNENARARPFSRMNIAPGRVALSNDETSLWRTRPASVSRSRLRIAGTGSRPKLLNS